MSKRVERELVASEKCEDYILYFSLAIARATGDKAIEITDTEVRNRIELQPR